MHLRLGTIGSYIDHGYTVTVHCKEYLCNRSSRLDLGKLAARLGRDFDVIEERSRLQAMLVCEKCGVKGNVQFTISPPYKGVRKERE